MSVEDIVSRCTRNGVTSWQHVAAQLGCSVESARKRYDPKYLPIRPWPHPCEEIIPAEPSIDENDTSSPHVKGPGLRAKIIALLDKQMMSTETMAANLGSPANSVRARLDRMLEAAQVFHDGRIPRLWGIVGEDGSPRIYASGSVNRLDFSGLNINADQQVAKVHLATEIAGAGRRLSRWAG